MTSTSNHSEAAGPNHKQDWIVVLGLAVSASAAAVSSFSGLTALGEAAGWPHWMAPLLPATVDALALPAQLGETVDPTRGNLITGELHMQCVELFVVP